LVMRLLRALDILACATNRSIFGSFSAEILENADGNGGGSDRGRCLELRCQQKRGNTNISGTVSRNTTRIVAAFFMMPPLPLVAYLNPIMKRLTC
jgi:hypothetical protein